MMLLGSSNKATSPACKKGRGGQIRTEVTGMGSINSILSQSEETLTFVLVILQQNCRLPKVAINIVLQSMLLLL